MSSKVDWTILKKYQKLNRVNNISVAAGYVPKTVHTVTFSGLVAGVYEITAITTYLSNAGNSDAELDMNVEIQSGATELFHINNTMTGPVTSCQRMAKIFVNKTAGTGTNLVVPVKIVSAVARTVNFYDGVMTIERIA